jgi:translation initiation factor 2 subunit 3
MAKAKSSKSQKVSSEGSSAVHNSQNSQKVSATDIAASNVAQSAQGEISKSAHANPAISQPSINVGLVGHVDHGKTTLTQSLSGKWTDTHSEELKRGITIKLGYADTCFYKDAAGKFTTKAKDPETKVENTFVRKISLVDAPGHESLMATMLAGSMIMDGALLLVSASEECPQAQTREHLSALEMCGIKNIIVVQNKIDLVSQEQTLRNYAQIREFLKGTPYADAPVIPISARLNINVDKLIEAIEQFIPTPIRDESLDPFMLIARSFDINKPGSSPQKMQGGILGGSLIQGRFKVGEMIEISPGRVFEQKNQVVHKPYQTKILKIMSGNHAFDSAGPGGSIAVLTELDPTLVKSDRLTGCVVGHPGSMPPVWYELKMQTTLLERVVGSTDELLVDPIRKLEPLMLNVNSATTVGIVTDVSKKGTICKLKLPICAAIGSRVTISRRVANRFRLIGYGIILEHKDK